MRPIRYIILALFLLVLVLVALANRTLTGVSLLPSGLPFSDNLTVEVPLFFVIFGSICTGLVVGYFLEYFREHKFRRRAAQKTREAAHLSAQVVALKKEGGKDEDDVLALLN